MTETRQILGRITALRQRLEQAPEPDPVPPGMGTLLRQIAAGDDHDAHLEAAVRPLTASPGADGPLPRQLTSRARRILEMGRDLLAQLRALADAFAPADDAGGLIAWDHPLARVYRETTTMADTALRIVPLLPATATAQMRLCEGLEAILGDIASRVRKLSAGMARRQGEEDRIVRLSGLLADLEAGRAADVQPFIALAEEELRDARDGVPLRFLTCVAAEPARFAACHGLTTARVLARVIRHDAELRARPIDLMLAALIHDAGMVRFPGEILNQPAPLQDEQRRLLEAHCHVGADLAARLAPSLPWLADAARSHHERVDGTGYPDGLREAQLAPLTRLLAVCDVYAALCSARSHRPALETRTALADTLVLADQGALDRDHAERLLHLSFYPVGQVVELADGALGVVVGPGSGRDLNSPARPTVALLIDAQGEPLPLPRHLDLGQGDGPRIVRTVPAHEQQEILGTHHPDWIAA